MSKFWNLKQEILTNIFHISKIFSEIHIMGNTISLYQKPAPTPVFKPDHLCLQYSNLTKEAKRIVRERWILGDTPIDYSHQVKCQLVY